MRLVQDICRRLSTSRSLELGAFPVPELPGERKMHYPSFDGGQKLEWPKGRLLQLLAKRVRDNKRPAPYAARWKEHRRREWSSPMKQKATSHLVSPKVP